MTERPMTRFIDDLYESPAATQPTPEEVDRLVAEARRMRTAAFASAFADIRRTLARVVTARPKGRRVTG